MFFGPQENLRWARDAVALPREQCRGCSTIELGRHIEPATGVEPITCDNPQLRPIKVLAHGHTADKKATVELPGVLRVALPSQATDRICTGIAGFTRTQSTAR